jgi:AcrR family transcriptional regulator
LGEDALGADSAAGERRRGEFPRRGPSRAERGRRGDILDAALKVFTEAGYTATGMQDIAYEARASIGSIYHHFKGKAELAAALHVEALADYHRGLLRELQHPEETAEAAVKALVGYHLRWVKRNRDLAAFVYTTREPDAFGNTAELLRHADRRILDAVGQWTARWVDAGELRALPLPVLHALVLGPSQELARHWLTGRVSESPESVEGELADAAWRAARA